MNVNLDWTLPVPRTTQRPLAHVRIEAQAQGAQGFTPLNNVVAPATSLLLQDVPRGDWTYRGVVVDVDGVESQNPKTAVISVPFDGPDDLGTLTATLA